MTEQRLVVSDKMDVLVNDEVNAGTFRAIQALKNRQVPPEIIQTRPGRGGKTFDYIPHTYVTETLVDGLDMYFSHDVLEARMCEDGSSFALVRLQIHIPIHQPDGTIAFFTNSITEVGAFDGPGAMLDAHKLAAAASRGLAKCLMRRFKIGLELYKQEGDVTPEAAWASLFEFAANQRHARGKEERAALKDEIVAALKEHGITGESLLDRFSEAYQIVTDLAKSRPATPPMEEPSEPEGIPEPEQGLTDEEIKSLVEAVETWDEFYDLAIKHLGYENASEVRRALKEVHGGDQQSLLSTSNLGNWELIRAHKSRSCIWKYADAGTGS